MQVKQSMLLHAEAVKKNLINSTCRRLCRGFKEILAHSGKSVRFQVYIDMNTLLGRLLTFAMCNLIKCRCMSQINSWI